MEYQKGDIVTVTDSGRCYSTYKGAALRMGFSAAWADGGVSHQCKDGEVFKVVGFTRHEDGDTLILGLEPYGDGPHLSNFVLISSGGVTRTEIVPPSNRQMVDYAKGIIRMDSELQELREEVEKLREFKRIVMEAAK